MGGEGGLWDLGGSETLGGTGQCGGVMGSGMEEGARGLWGLGVWHGRESWGVRRLGGIGRD